MAVPRPVERRVAASLLLCGAAALAACNELLVDPAAASLQLGLALAASVAAGGSAEAFDKADAISVRVTAGEAIVFDEVLPFASAGGDVTLAVPISSDAAGAEVIVQVELLQGQAPLFVGSGTLTPEAGGDNAAEIALTPVAAAVLITPASFTFDALGANTTYRAVAVFATGDTIDGSAPTFRSLARGIVQISASGRAISVAPGTTRVEAALGSTAAQADAVVRQVVTTIQVNQPQAAVAAGATYAFEPTLRDRNDYLVAGRTVAWTSSNRNILRIDANGVATAVGTGTVTVTGTVDQATIAFQVRVADPVPAAPSGLAVVVRNTTAILTWRDNSSNETRFEVRVRTAPSAPFGSVAATAANATRLSNDTDQPDARLEYAVRACNAAGCSANSNVVVAVTVPNAPSDVDIDFSTNEPRVSWTDNSSVEDYFHIEVHGDSLAPEIAEVVRDQTNYTAQMSPRSVYVSACNAAGCSDYAAYTGSSESSAAAIVPVRPARKGN
jgi:hypothetical protein